MVEMSIESDFDELPDGIEKYARNLGPEIDAAMQEIGQAMRDRLEEITPKRTGETAAAWTVVPGLPGEFFITNSNEPVISYLTQGTAPHGPVTAKFLHWVDDAGQDVFAKWVSGIVGEDYEAEVLEEFQPLIDELLDAADEAAWRSSL